MEVYAFVWFLELLEEEGGDDGRVANSFEEVIGQLLILRPASQIWKVARDRYVLFRSHVIYSLCGMEISKTLEKQT